jgi:hypothetical protein
MTRLLFGRNFKRVDSTVANAFQHALWVALMVRSIAHHNQQARRHRLRRQRPRQPFRKALYLARLWEDNGVRSGDRARRRRSRMDLHNNRVGYNYGRRYARRHNDEFMCNGILDKIYTATYRSRRDRRLTYNARRDKDGRRVRRDYSRGCEEIGEGPRRDIAPGFY